MSQYEALHEIMLNSPTYTAFENAKITYLILQIADCSDAVNVQGLIVDPLIPEGGTIKEFVKMEEGQQVAILSLPPAAKVVVKMHDHIKNMQKALRSSDDEAIQQWMDALRQVFNEFPNRVRSQ